MSDTIRGILRRVDRAEPPEVFSVYEVELTRDGRTLVTSRFQSIEFIAQSGQKVTLSREAARLIADAILDALNADDGAETNQ